MQEEMVNEAADSFCGKIEQFCQWWEIAGLQCSQAELVPTQLAGQEEGKKQDNKREMLWLSENKCWTNGILYIYLVQQNMLWRITQNNLLGTCKKWSKLSWVKHFLELIKLNDPFFEGPFQMFYFYEIQIPCPIKQSWNPC